MKGRMEFLVGSQAQLAPVWRAFGIAPQTNGRDHSSYTVLVDASTWLGATSYATSGSMRL